MEYIYKSILQRETYTNASLCSIESCSSKKDLPEPLILFPLSLYDCSHSACGTLYHQPARSPTRALETRTEDREKEEEKQIKLERLTDRRVETCLETDRQVGRDGTSIQQGWDEYKNCVFEYGYEYFRLLRIRIRRQ